MNGSFHEITQLLKSIRNTMMLVFVGRVSLPPSQNLVSVAYRRINQQVLSDKKTISIAYGQGAGGTMLTFY